jgi:hypothetical protein
MWRRAVRKESGSSSHNAEQQDQSQSETFRHRVRETTKPM